MSRHLKVEVPDLCTGILGGLVGVTPGGPWLADRDALLLGLFCGVLAVAGSRVLACPQHPYPRTKKGYRRWTKSRLGFSNGNYMVLPELLYFLLLSHPRLQVKRV